MDKNTFSPSQSVHSLSDIDDYHNLSGFICPPSPQDNSEIEQIAVNTPAKDLALNSDAFILWPEIPSTVHVIAPVGWDYDRIILMVRMGKNMGVNG